MDEDLVQLLERLLAAGVEFVVVGGIAAVIHGSRQNTDDLDIAAKFSRDNVARLLAALGDTHPKHVTRPDLGEISDDPDHFTRYRNLYLVTDLGRLDILGELPPLGGYDEIAATAVRIDISGRECAVISLDHLIMIKESVARPKDLIVAAELKAIRDHRDLPGRRD